MLKLNVKKKGSKNTILVMSDSHARGCATQAKHNLSKNFKVCKNLKWYLQLRQLTPKLSKVCYQSFKGSNE